MNRIKKLAAVFAFSLLILGLPTLASAQWRDRDRDRDDDNYGRNGGYYNRGQLQSAIERLKNNSKEFSRRLDRELDDDRYYRRNNYGDRLLDLAKDFRKAADRLEDEFDGGRNLRDSENEARRVIDLGRQLNNELYNARLSYNIENDWNSMRQDLRTISNAYGYGNYDNNRRGRGRGNGNGGWKNRFPFPLPF